MAALSTLPHRSGGVALTPALPGETYQVDLYSDVAYHTVVCDTKLKLEATNLASVIHQAQIDGQCINGDDGDRSSIEYVNRTQCLLLFTNNKDILVENTDDQEFKGYLLLAPCTPICFRHETARQRVDSSVLELTSWRLLRCGY